MNASSSRNVGQKARGFGIVAIAALAGFVLGAAAYERADQERSALERETAMDERVKQAARDYYLVNELGKGKTDDVRQVLNFELAGILRELHAIGDPADPVRQAWVDKLCLHIVRDEKQHPEYFLTASASARLQEERDWAALQGEMPVSPTVASQPRPETSVLEKN